jgi:voltage-gated potassium channel Kch
MIYFSAVTITTLGFGDIVPITAHARTSVIEAISGVILIGLFLNALARDRG